ncbi:MAG: CRTAC1 family protein [Verrucomicrobiales bacterium]|nr:CRTAC1 family protein [Verrucomicrobiales bacterium]
MASHSQPSPDNHSDDTARYDDSVIGRATRWSIAVAVAGIVVVGGLWLWLGRKAPPPPQRVTELAAPTPAPSALAQAPTVAFTDITTVAGIRFSHFNGAEGEKLLPETMGGGGAFLDYDGDGDQDILFVNGAPWPWSKNAPSPMPTHALYQNEGNGRFRDVTAGSGLDVTTYGMGVACGDFDNDGRVDVFITGVGANRLFRNLGNGKFQDVTRAAGVEGSPDAWSSGAAFLDVDRDGDLDLFVVNYVKWSREIDFQVGFSLDGHNRAYGPPMNFQGAFPFLYRNEGGGRFSDVSSTAGVQIKNPATGVPAAKSLGIAPADLNGDGWIDLVVANDTVQNMVFTNRHDGTFAESGASMGVAFDSMGNARGAMGIDVARHRNDDSMAIGIGNFANEMTAMYVASKSGDIFTDEAIAEGIGPASRRLLKFGLFFFDYDLDGWLDVLTANGHLEEEISKIQQSQSYRQPAQLFWNAGAHDGGFVEIDTSKAGTDLFQPIVGRGSAFADIDGDGDLDVLLFQASGPPRLLRNDQNLNHHWVRFRLTGKGSNRDAIGAWVKVTAGGLTQNRQVMPTRSYLSQSELPVTFGLGKAETIDAVEILWPNGGTQKLEGLPINATHAIRER